MDREMLEAIMAMTVADGTLPGRMGIKIVSASASRVVATMPVDGNTQPHGLLHGRPPGVYVAAHLPDQGPRTGARRKRHRSSWGTVSERAGRSSFAPRGGGSLTWGRQARGVQ